EPRGHAQHDARGEHRGRRWDWHDWRRTMTGRDRLILTFIAAIAILGAAYVLVVSPERNRASTVSGELGAASARLSSAESKLSEARQAQARYSAAYASIVTLGKAVPTGEEVPSLIYQLAQATHQKSIDFSS